MCVKLMYVKQDRDIRADIPVLFYAYQAIVNSRVS